MRGTEESFNKIVSELVRLNKEHDTGKIKYISYADGIENIFANFGWSKSEFHQEMDKRLNRYHCNVRPKAKKAKTKTK